MKFWLTGLVFAGFVCGSLAQSNDTQKFSIYGFSDLSFSKSFVKDESPLKLQKSKFTDGNACFSLDHLNLYQDYKPNEHIRFLTELSYQSKALTQGNEAGKELITRTNIPGIGVITSDTMLRSPVIAPDNSVFKNYQLQEWGSIAIERAQLSVNINRYFNITAGQFITPAGIWNVDHGSPVIMTVRQPIEFSMYRIFPKSQLGIMDEGRIFLGDADLGYSVYFTNGRQTISMEKLTDLACGGQLRLNLPLFSDFRIGASGYSGINTQTSETMVLSLDTADMAPLVTQAIKQLTSSGRAITPSNLKSELSPLIAAKASNVDYASFTKTDLYQARENVFGLDFKLRQSIFTLQGEFNFSQTLNQLQNDAESRILGGYALASADAYQRDNLTITPYVCWEKMSISDAQNNPKIMMNGIVQLDPDGKSPIDGYQVFFAGLNTRFFANCGLKN